MTAPLLAPLFATLAALVVLAATTPAEAQDGLDLARDHIIPRFSTGDPANPQGEAGMDAHERAQRQISAPAGFPATLQLPGASGSGGAPDGLELARQRIAGHGPAQRLATGPRG